MELRSLGSLKPDQAIDAVPAPGQGETGPYPSRASYWLFELADAR